MPRPYRSPLGIPGALVALLIALSTLVTLFVASAVATDLVAALARQDTLTKPQGSLGRFLRIPEEARLQWQGLEICTCAQFT